MGVSEKVLDPRLDWAMRGMSGSAKARVCRCFRHSRIVLIMTLDPPSSG